MTENVAKRRSTAALRDPGTDAEPGDPVASPAITVQRALETAALPAEPPVSPVQLKLLQTLFLTDEGTARRFAEWVKIADVRDLEDGSYRLYPLLYRILETSGIRHPLTPFFKGIYRRTLYKNSLLAQRLKRLLTRLQDGGIEVMLLKGIALNGLLNLERGLRPMADIDLMVKPPDLPATLEFFPPDQRRGWDPAVIAAMERYRYGYTFYGEAGLEFDLHWHLMPGFGLMEGADAPFWEASSHGAFQQQPVRYPSVTDLVFHLLAHGMRWDPVPPIRWIPDALFLLRHQPSSVDWRRLANLSRRYRKSLALHAALDYLARHFLAPVSMGLQALANNRVGELEMAEFRVEALKWDTPVDWGDTCLLAEHQLAQLRRDPKLPPPLLRLREGLANPATLAWCRRRGLSYLVDLALTRARVQYFGPRAVEGLRRSSATRSGPASSAHDSLVTVRLDGGSAPAEAAIPRHLCDKLYATFIPGAMGHPPRGLSLIVTDATRLNADTPVIEGNLAWRLLSPLSARLAAISELRKLPFADRFFQPVSGDAT